MWLFTALINLFWKHVSWLCSNTLSSVILPFWVYYLCINSIENLLLLAGLLLRKWRCGWEHTQKSCVVMVCWVTAEKVEVWGSRCHDMRSLWLRRLSDYGWSVTVLADVSSVKLLFYTTKANFGFGFAIYCSR